MDKLRTLYEEKLGKRVSDATWYRVTASIRACGEVNNYTVETYARLRKKYPHLPVDISAYGEITSLTKKFVADKQTLTGKEFHETLAKFTGYSIPKPTIYRFFNQSNIRFSTQKEYKVHELQNVIISVAIWIVKKNKQFSSIEVA